MNGPRASLTVEWLDGCSVERLEGVASLVAEDASGQFGLLPGHETMLTVLAPGLIRCRLPDGSWRHLAGGGGPLLCRDNLVQLVAPRFLLADDAAALTARLAELRQREHAERKAEQQSRLELERALIKRLRAWSERQEK